MELQKIREALDTYIRPATFPVAVKMVGSADEIPAKVKMPKRDLGKLLPVCLGVAIARRYGWSLALGMEDMACPLGALTLGFLPVKPKYLDGSFDVPFWVKNQEIRAKINHGMPRLEQGRYTHLVLAPLHRAEFEPQLIIIYGNPAQIGKLIQATVYGTGEPLVSPSIGGGACSEQVARTILTNQYQFLMVGGGDRTVAQTQDHEASFTVPWSKVEPLIEGLEGTHNAGMRYPTPSYLTYEMEFPPDFIKLMDYLKQEG